MAPKFRRTEDGLLEQDVNGYKALVIDPDGSYEREHSAPAPDAYAAIAPQPATPVATGMTPGTGMTPEQAAALNQPSVVGPTANPGAPMPDVPKAVPQVAPLAGGTAPRATIVDQPVGAGGGGMATTTQNTWSKSESTEGLDKESKAKVEAAGKKVSEGMKSQADLEQQAGKDVAAQREARASQDYMSGFIKQVGALEAEDRYKRDYETARAEIKAARNQPLDPSKAFGSEKNQWAFIAGLGGALAALDEGIARLQKRGGAQPFDMIDKMVENSLKQQEAERTQRIAAGQESADDAHDAMLNQRMLGHEAAAQVLDARKLLASSSEEASFLESAAAKQRLQADIHQEDLAKSIATKKSVSKSSGGQSQTAPAGPAKAPNKQQHDDRASLRNLYRIRDIIARAEKSGELANVTGWQDKLGANSMQDFLGGLPEGQREALTAIEELKVAQLMQSPREANNVKTQNMQQNMGMPKNDRDIPAFRKRLDSLIQMQEETAAELYPEAPAETREAY